MKKKFGFTMPLDDQKVIDEFGEEKVIKIARDYSATDIKLAAERSAAAKKITKLEMKIADWERGAMYSFRGVFVVFLVTFVAGSFYHDAILRFFKNFSSPIPMWATVGCWVFALFLPLYNLYDLGRVLRLMRINKRQVNKQNTPISADVERASKVLKAHFVHSKEQLYSTDQLLYFLMQNRCLIPKVSLGHLMKKLRFKKVRRNTGVFYKIALGKHSTQKLHEGLQPEAQNVSV